MRERVEQRSECVCESGVVLDVGEMDGVVVCLSSECVSVRCVVLL